MFKNCFSSENDPFEVLRFSSDNLMKKNGNYTIVHHCLDHVSIMLGNGTLELSEDTNNIRPLSTAIVKKFEERCRKEFPNLVHNVRRLFPVRDANIVLTSGAVITLESLVDTGIDAVRFSRCILEPFIVERSKSAYAIKRLYLTTRGSKLVTKLKRLDNLKLPKI